MIDDMLELLSGGCVVVGGGAVNFQKAYVRMKFIIIIQYASTL